MAQSEKIMKGDITSFANEMKKMVNSKDMSDIKFLIGPVRKTFHAHRCVLSARCEVFRAMFSDQTHKHKDGEVPFVLSDISPEVFQAMLEFIYTHCVTLNGKIAIDVLAVSIEYGLEGLRQLCVEYLIESLSVNSACDTMQAAVAYGQDELSDSTLDYIEQNTQNVFRSKSFHEMSDAALSTVLQSNYLLMDEKDILDAVKEWATVNSVVLGKKRSEVGKKVIRHVRLPLLTSEEIKNVEEENKKDMLVPIDHISYAWKVHALQTAEKDDPLTTLRKGTVSRPCHQSLQLSPPN